MVNRSEREFVVLLAHELRGPLSAISNCIVALRHTASSVPTAQASLAILERQANQMKRIITEFVDLSATSPDSVTLTRTRVSLDQLLNTAVESSGSLISARGQKFTMITPPERIDVYVDFTRLTQVISNLLTNAAKYTDRAGDIWLTVQQAEGNLVMSVRNTGIGISAEALPRIFEMHWQAERSASSRGLGLGLALAKQFVEAHGGSIHANSDGLGKGSEFIVRLPSVIDNPAKAN